MSTVLLKRLLIFLASAAIFVSATLAAQNTEALRCENNQTNLEYWREIRQSVVDKDVGINPSELAPKLAACLSSSNAELRDRIGYEVLTYWMRSKALSSADVAQLQDQLLPMLNQAQGQPGDSAFARAFAALVLSETVRYDSLEQSMSQKEFLALSEQAVLMFRQERDYRGLTEQFGWIHTVAHGADLLWRLAMHPNSTVEQHIALLGALETQITRSETPAFTFNEFDRMARVVQAIVARETLTKDQITEWLEIMASPAPLEQWGDAFSSVEGMQQLHNRKQFLRALYFSLEPQTHSELKQQIEKAQAQLP